MESTFTLNLKNLKTTHRVKWTKCVYERNFFLPLFITLKQNEHYEILWRID